TQVDLTAVNAQTQRLLVSFVFTATALGLFLIWIEVLPALERMNEVRLWSYAETASAAPADSVDGNGGGANGNGNGNGTAQNGATSDSGARTTRAARTAETSKDSSATLGMLIGSLLILTMTLVAVRNIP